MSLDDVEAEDSGEPVESFMDFRRRQRRRNAALAVSGLSHVEQVTLGLARAAAGNVYKLGPTTAHFFPRCDAGFFWLALDRKNPGDFKTGFVPFVTLRNKRRDDRENDDGAA
jgi:hypothetical protein